MYSSRNDQGEIRNYYESYRENQRSGKKEKNNSDEGRNKKLV